ncbi:hypothetical protein CBM2625_A90203 [Cupriavidus taiwanensis]|nr:hypothetical protein CBM2625_A90203 [Cupriavidus taiwanensis]
MQYVFRWSQAKARRPGRGTQVQRALSAAAGAASGTPCLKSSTRITKSRSGPGNPLPMIEGQGTER